MDTPPLDQTSNDEQFQQPHTPPEAPSDEKRGRRPSLLVTVTRPTLLAGAIVGSIWLGGHPQHLPGALRQIAESGDHGAAATTNAPGRTLADEARGRILKGYYRKVDDTELQQAGVDGMVASLDDPYSRYLDPKETQAFQEDASGSYAGIGITISASKEGARIESIQRKGPAYAGGLRRGDVIVSVAGESTRGLSNASQAADLIRGDAGTLARITFKRGSRSLTREITRKQLTYETVTSQRIPLSGGGYATRISISQFAGGTGKDFTRELQRADGSRALLLDLRNNPGGVVDEAAEVVSSLQQRGVVTELRSRLRGSDTLRVSGDTVDTETPLRVLVNGGSASASEIVAGALQDSGRGELVGARTFGKGVYQQTVPLSRGALELSVGQYYTPKGRNLGDGTKRGKGLNPDVKASAGGTQRAALSDLKLRQR